MRISDWSSDLCASNLSLLRCRPLHWSVDLDVSGLVAFVNLIDRLNERVGRAVAWLTLLMLLITFPVVVLRYVYSIGWVWMQDSYVWLHRSEKRRVGNKCVRTCRSRRSRYN